MTVPMIRTPPKSCLPNPETNPEWYGEMWLKYPLSVDLVPLRYSWVIKSKAEFSIILNEAILEFKSSQGNQKPDKSRAERLEGIVKRLRRWHTELPNVLSPSKLAFPSQLKIQ